MNIVERIAALGFIATVANVEALAREHATSHNAANRTGATYLSILIACTQQRIAAGSARRTKNALDALEAIHKELYPGVLKGVAVKGESTVETSRRATFARTNKSTLAAYLKAGKPLSELNPHDTSKRWLRAAIAPPPAENRTARILDNSKESIVRAVQREAKQDLIGAKRNLSLLIDELVSQLDELNGGEDVNVVNMGLARHRPSQYDQHAS